MTRAAPLLIFDAGAPADERAPSLIEARSSNDQRRRLGAEATKLEAWYGKNAYSDFLLKHGCRPDPNQAGTIGWLMGARVKASDGRMYPRRSAERKAPRAEQRQIASEARKALEIQHFLSSLAHLALVTEEPARLLDAAAIELEEPEIREQLRHAVKWLTRIAQEWKRREAGRTD